jgi:hypothetical protein
VKTVSWQVGCAWHALRVAAVTAGITLLGCDRPLDVAAAGQLLKEGDVVGKSVFCQTPLRVKGGVPWLWGDEYAGAADGAADCMAAARKHGVINVDLITRRVADGAPSSIDGAYYAIVPVAGRSEIRDGRLLVSCGTTRAMVFDVETKGDVATILYGEEMATDMTMLVDVVACDPGTPALDSQSRKVRAFRVGGQWYLGR